MVTAAALRCSVLAVTTEILRQQIFSLIKITPKKGAFKNVFCWITHIHILSGSKKISKYSGKTEKENHQICVGLLFIKLCLKSVG